MIKSLTFRPDQSDYYKWLKDKPFVKDKEEIIFEFKPGLNILMGENGCGKSTVLKYIALKEGILESGRLYKGQTNQFLKLDQEKISTAIIDRDPGEIRYFDPLATPGLVGGGAGFDYDVPLEVGLRNIFNKKCSRGQITLNRVYELIIDVLNGDKETVLLLDEPDDGLSPFNALQFWRKMASLPNQIITASQNLMCLGLDDVNYIDLSPQWRQVNEGLILILSDRIKKRA